ncbi:MAG: MATE family efflux transporter [Phocaeicola sp.]
MDFKNYSSHYKELAKLGIPIVIGQVGMVVLGFADTLMIARHSTNELAAASFVNNMFVLAIVFSTGFGYGLTPVIGSLWGKGEKDSVGRMVKNSLFLNTLLAIVLLLLMTLLYFNIHRLGQPEELYPLMLPYFLILLGSIPFLTWFNTFKQFCDAIGDTHISMWILLSGNLLNIIGNYLLIYGKYGFPEWGLEGAGISTLLSRIYMTLLFAAIFFFSKRYKMFSSAFKKSLLNRKDYGYLTKLGVPIGLQMGMETAAFALSTVMVGWLGTMQLAAHQVMLTISQLCFMIYYGMGAAVAVRISYFHGQKDKVGINRSATACFHLILTMAFISVLPILLMRNELGIWFTGSEKVAFLVAQLTIPLLLYQFGDGMQCNYANALRGITDVKPVMIIAFIAYFLISLPAGYIFGFILKGGLFGIWMAFPFGLTTAGIMYYARFRQQMNKMSEKQRGNIDIL